MLDSVVCCGFFAEGSLIDPPSPARLVPQQGTCLDGKHTELNCTPREVVVIVIITINLYLIKTFIYWTKYVISMV